MRHVCTTCVPLLFVFGSFGCAVDTPVELRLFEPVAGSALDAPGFQCTCSEDTPEIPRFAIVPRVALVLELVTWNSEGFPSCRLSEQNVFCLEDDCRVRPETPRACTDVELGPTTLEVDPAERAAVLADRMERVRSALGQLVLRGAPDRPVQARLVATESTCAELGFVDGDWDGVTEIADYDPTQLVACTNVCPGQLGESEGLLSNVANSCNEIVVQQCARTPLWFAVPTEFGEPPPGLLSCAR